MAALYGSDDSDHIDPRRIRSRNRLLDAAATLLSTGGVEAVTVEAVTRMSQVARTTLYRNFDSATELVAAAFDRLLPPVETLQVPVTAPVRESLVGLLHQQAELIERAPLQLTAMAWVAMGPEEPRDDSNVLTPLRSRIIDQYRQPFDEVLNSASARDELHELDVTLALTQLVGPLIFARLTGIRALTRADRERIVDDFLTAHRRAELSNRAL